MGMCRAITFCLLACSLFNSGLLVVAVCNKPDGVIYPNYFTGSYTGSATYYGAYDGGGCTINPTPYAGTNGVFTTVAIASDLWDGSAACGMCINMTATGTGSGANPISGSKVVFVNNECPTCSAGGLDMALTGDGSWGIKWHAIPCPVGSTFFSYMMQGSQEWYIKIQVRNSRLPVQDIALLQGTTWKPFVRTSDNFFTAGSTVVFPVTGPMTFEITSVGGDVVQDTVQSIENNVVINGNAQFPDCSSTGSGGSSSTTKVASSSTSAHVSTGSSSTTGSAPKTSWIYVDSLVAPWQDWSWANHSNSVSPVYSGSDSYSFIPDSWEAAFFVNPGGINTATNKSIVFWIYSTVQLSNQLTVALLTISGSTNTAVGPVQVISAYAATNPTAANAWTLVTIPLADFPSGSYDAIWLQDNTGATNNPRVYVDSIEIVGY